VQNVNVLLSGEVKSINATEIILTNTINQTEMSIPLAQNLSIFYLEPAQTTDGQPQRIPAKIDDLSSGVVVNIFANLHYNGSISAQIIDIVSSINQ